MEKEREKNKIDNKSLKEVDKEGMERDKYEGKTG